MIPSVVELTDFLSHRSPNGEPVTFDFDGAVLWSVAGDNGAGKSAIFDAITWTLYGQHRGGTQDARRLISHGAEAAHAAFEFVLDGERYRVERSIRRRGGGRRAALRRDQQKQHWEEIPSTTSEGGFARWRDELLGLSYQAFTHAVLLIQGGSDRLVSSGAKERFEILAQLIDLSAYRRLEARARERTNAARARGAAYAAELERLPGVAAEQRAAAEAELERVGTERTAREAAWRRQVAVVEGARAYAALLERKAAIEPGIAAGEALVSDAERIRAEAAELAALGQARPHLEAGLAALAAAQAALGDHGASIAAEQLASAVAAARRRRTAARRAAGAARERATALRGRLPLLETALQRRLELLDAEQAAAAAGASSSSAATVQEAEAMLAQLVEGRDEARAAERRGERSAAKAAAAAEEAEAALAQARAGRGETVCVRCGQQVGAGHRRAHVAHLRQELADKRATRRVAEAALAPLSATRREAEAAVERARQIVAELSRAHDRALDAERAAARARDAAVAARTALGAWKDRRAKLLDGGSSTQVERLRTDVRAEAADADREERERADAVAQAEEAVQAATEAASEVRRAEIELAQVPDAWLPRARGGEPELLVAFEERMTALAPAGAQAAALHEAEQGLATLRAAHTELSTQLAALPREHAVTLSDAEAELARHVQALEQTTARVDRARGQLRELDQRERERDALHARLGEASHEERLAARLATLLGRQGIQGHLIVRAAHGLERLANDTLRALSGGMLELEISAEERRGRDEIVISARDYNAGGERTDASFLSGSEKFRVCVALAAATGTYASGRTAIESLIIDEGFGSLDETSRDEMIDELQRLAQLLKRVIVVSHQGEFHDRARFPHGYRLRRNGSATEVERFV